MYFLREITKKKKKVGELQNRLLTLQQLKSKEWSYPPKSQRERERERESPQARPAKKKRKINPIRSLARRQSGKAKKKKTSEEPTRNTATTPVKRAAEQSSLSQLFQ